MIYVVFMWCLRGRPKMTQESNCQTTDSGNLFGFCDRRVSSSREWVPIDDAWRKLTAGPENESDIISL
jgi:hypothetical protein